MLTFTTLIKLIAPIMVRLYLYGLFLLAADRIGSAYMFYIAVFELKEAGYQLDVTRWVPRLTQSVLALDWHVMGPDTKGHFSTLTKLFSSMDPLSKMVFRFLIAHLKNYGAKPSRRCSFFAHA